MNKNDDIAELIATAFFIVIIAVTMIALAFNYILLNGFITLIVFCIFGYCFSYHTKIIIGFTAICGLVSYCIWPIQLENYQAIQEPLWTLLQGRGASDIISNFDEISKLWISAHINLLYELSVWVTVAPILAPAGLISGAILGHKSMLHDAYQKGAKQTIKTKKKQFKISSRFVASLAKYSARRGEGTLIGGGARNKKIVIPDKDLNQHLLVLGPTGSGKTVTIANFVESWIEAEKPVIFIDGKGDRDLSEKILCFADKHQRETYFFSADESYSDNYDPFYVGGYTSIKDRVMATLDWSEVFYEKTSEVYLQTTIKVMKECGEPMTMENILKYLDLTNLINLLRSKEAELKNCENLLEEVGLLDNNDKNLQGLKLGLQSFANSEAAKKLSSDDHAITLRFKNAIEEKAVAYVSLSPLEYPKMAKSLGRLMINDLKATLSEFLKYGGQDVLLIFDEFSSFGGDEILNLINQGRSAGAHIITGTQSVADLERSVEKGGEAFKEQMLANHKTFILHAQTTASNAEFFSKSIGTKNAFEPTIQIDEDGVTGLGSIRETQQFRVSPNEFRDLKQGEAYILTNLSDKPPVKIGVRLSKVVSKP